MVTPQFHNASLDALYAYFQSTPEGLSPSIAAKRLRERSPTRKRESRIIREWRLLFRQFINPLQALLIFAVILSLFLGDSTDAVIILVIVLIAGLLGYWQESNAGKSMEKIRQLITVKHTVLREGEEALLESEQVVPGDILLLDAGDLIPADCRILESNELHVNESSITGESFPVEKIAGLLPESLPLHQRTNCLWQGTNVISGTAKAMAFATGDQSLFGQMVKSLSQPSESAFQKGIRRFGHFLLRITLFISVIVLLGKLYLHAAVWEAALFSLALAVGMAPELLPAIMTFSMSAGARMMMKKKVLIKQLSSVFNLGELNVLCTDKTGTITEGSITVAGMLDAEGSPCEEIQLYAFLNASLQQGFSNPIDTAIKKLNVATEGYEKINEVPYDFIRKRLSIGVKKDGHTWIVTKGAFQNVIRICTHYKPCNGPAVALTPSATAGIETVMREKSQAGFRVLGLAIKETRGSKISKEEETDMVFLGFILLEDQLKATAARSIERLKQLHIDVKIITGDNRYAIHHTALQLGMDDPKILTGEAVDRLTTEALAVQARQIHLFAEIAPHQKERIIKAIQQSGMVAGFLGDGINDVAAIHAADIGISTDNAVDAAKEAADFVLLEKDLSVLADGITEGRKCFSNSKKYMLITTGATFGNMLSVAAASFFLPFLPMLPKQLLLNNLITDLPFMAIYSDKVDARQLEQPGKWDLRMMRHFMWVFGLHSSLFDFLTFYLLFFKWRLSEGAFQTGWFLESAATEILILFIIRTRRVLWKSRPAVLLTVSGLSCLLLIMVFPYLPFAKNMSIYPLPITQLLALCLLLAAYVLTGEGLKYLFYTYMDKNN